MIARRQDEGGAEKGGLGRGREIGGEEEEKGGRGREEEGAQVDSWMMKEGAWVGIVVSAQLHMLPPSGPYCSRCNSKHTYNQFNQTLPRADTTDTTHNHPPTHNISVMPTIN